MKLFILLVSLLYSSICLCEDGNQLLEDCKTAIKLSENTLTIKSTENYFNIGTCYGYLFSQIDTNKFIKNPSFCLPETVELNQFTKVVVKYLEEHPEQLHILAAALVQAAGIQYFPCK